MERSFQSWSHHANFLGAYPLIELFRFLGPPLNRIHFLVQAVPRYSVMKVVTIIKSLTAKEIFRRAPQVKE